MMSQCSAVSWRKVMLTPIKTAVVPEKQERSTVQLSEPEGVDADTDFEDLGDASHMTGSCVEEPESRCSWETGSTKGSNCSGLATSDASTEELDSPLSGSKGMVDSDISSEQSHEHKADAQQEPWVHCVGKRARRAARRSRGGKEAAIVPEKQECRMHDVTVQRSELEEGDADTDLEDLGDASHMTGSCVEEPESRCSWETGSTKGSNCSGLATSDASTEELDSPLSGSKGMVDSEISSEEFESSAENSCTWLGTSFWSSEGFPKEVVAGCELKLGSQWHVTCMVVKNTFLEQVDLGEQEEKAMLQRTRSCSSLPTLCV
eukprot:TRINITY_DN33_c0_g1_i3.p2 TRINITY_DN33_c0_g1~~TRINITY_DN33_c0_g1_i3.p2  ORF type:complete len:319 (-),score=57.96 TRINITY_DN33_c0_g1_i3:292-1248(-)